MNASDNSNNTSKRLYGPTVQYADGKVVPGRPLDVESIIAEFEQSETAARNAFLCAFAHDLTVAVREILFDRPVSEADIDKVKEINESLHQLTSCLNPRKHWSAYDEALLLQAIVEGSFAHDLDRWIGHALALAAGNRKDAKRPVKAK
ncbi:MAG: hypothetical protein WA417_07030 [Stellaceae bacterium]